MNICRNHEGTTTKPTKQTRPTKLTKKAILTTHNTTKLTKKTVHHRTLRLMPSGRIATLKFISNPALNPAIRM